MIKHRSLHERIIFLPRLALARVRPRILTLDWGTRIRRLRSPGLSNCATIAIIVVSASAGEGYGTRTSNRPRGRIIPDITVDGIACIIIHPRDGDEVSGGGNRRAGAIDV